MITSTAPSSSSTDSSREAANLENNQIIESSPDNQSSFSELMLAKIPQGASSDTSTPAPTSEFTFPQDQFCLIGKAIKNVESFELVIYQKDADTSLVRSKGPSLGLSEFKHCQALSLNSGAYQLEIKTNLGLEEKINFTVK